MKQSILRKRISIAQPRLGSLEFLNVTQVIESGRLSMGAFVKKFEDCCAWSMGASHATAVSSGTAALHAALMALGLGDKRNQRVVVPACTYVATANAVRYCGAEPVFVDVRSDTWTVDPVRVKEAVEESGAAGVITVDLYGVPALLPIEAAAVEPWVLQDACEAHGTPIYGDAATLSFYGNKIVTCGEGGAVVTDDPELADRVRLYRGQGTSGRERYVHEVVGFNYRMTELQAAVGCAQMGQLEEFMRLRRQLRMAYDAYLPTGLGVDTQLRPDGAADWVYPILVKHRDEVAQRLEEAGVETRPVFPALHTQPPYRTGQSLPVSEMLAERGLLLPLHLGMQEADVVFICHTLAQAMKEAA